MPSSVASLLLDSLAGGHAPAAGTERAFRFEFPEAPGALNRFLEAIDAGAGSAKLNVSLFHYRNYGHDFGRVLVAIQTPSTDEIKAVDAFLEAVPYDFVDESDNPIYQQFLGSDD